MQSGNEPGRLQGPELRGPDDGMLQARWGSSFATVPISASGLAFAHLGCQRIRRSVARLGDLPPIVRESCDRKYGSAWRRPTSASGSVALALATGVRDAGLTACTLIDTMRGGSDYWRPGKFLTDAAEALRLSGLDVSYARHDELCPELQLLDRYRRDESMGFIEYGKAYAEQLAARDDYGYRVGSYAVVESLARGDLPVFYCTDPYTPDYSSALGARDVPFDQRILPEDPGGYLRNRGCHRVVLAEYLALYLRGSGVEWVIFELDANAGAAYRRQSR